MATESEIYDTLQALIAAGDEGAARSYLLEHLAELPEDLGSAIMLDMFTDGMEQYVGGLELQQSIKKEAPAAADELQRRAKKDD